MKKLKLNLTDLKVDSFSLNLEDKKTKGTVVGQRPSFYVTCETEIGPECRTVFLPDCIEPSQFNTCLQSCNGTCNYTCNGTCFNSCNGTCNITCNNHTCYAELCHVTLERAICIPTKVVDCIEPL